MIGQRGTDDKRTLCDLCTGIPNSHNNNSNTSHKNNNNNQNTDNNTDDELIPDTLSTGGSDFRNTLIIASLTITATLSIAAHYEAKRSHCPGTRC